MEQQTNVKKSYTDHIVAVSETQRKAWDLICVARMVPAFARFLQNTRPTASRSLAYAAFNRFPQKSTVVMNWVREQAILFATQNNLLHEPGA